MNEHEFYRLETYEVWNSAPISRSQTLFGNAIEVQSKDSKNLVLESRTKYPDIKPSPHSSSLFS
ncbi:MAG: hypothetical protein K9M80_09605 [Candidatus Marinimicrobia bacterium]|nr:hypothetical protein [Candidatus Neomarinimicrobiota bacterium]